MKGGEKMNDIIVRLVDVPVDLKGIVKEDSNGDYNIYINARHSSSVQLETYFHEEAHARLGHLHSDKSIEEIELEAQKEAGAMMGDSTTRLPRG